MAFYFINSNLSGIVNKAETKLKNVIKSFEMMFKT